MRTLAIVTLACLAGCGDDSTMRGGGGADQGAQVGGDLAVSSAPDMAACMFREFAGYPGSNPTPLSLDCSCGCLIDSFEGNVLSGNWGASTTPLASFAPMQGVGLGMSLASTAASGQTTQAGLASGGPIAAFYLDGDFDLQVDYDLGPVAAPGEAHLILGARHSQLVQGLPVFQVERAREADGSEVYATQLGGVPAVQVATTATHGRLRLVRAGFTLTSFADGQQLSTLIAQDAGRLEVTLTGTLLGCGAPDAGASCGYQPFWHELVLNSGTLVNQP